MSHRWTRINTDQKPYGGLTLLFFLALFLYQCKSAFVCGC